MTLENDFHHSMLNIYRVMKDKGYGGSRFKQLVDQYHGVQAAKRLLGKHEIQSGLMVLCTAGELDNSMEVLVLQDKYRELFTEEELREAHQRLEDLDYFKPKAPRP
jgi:hypothetical protein